MCKLGYRSGYRALREGYKCKFGREGPKLTGFIFGATGAVRPARLISMICCIKFGRNMAQQLVKGTKGLCEKACLKAFKTRLKCISKSVLIGFRRLFKSLLKDMCYAF